MAFNFGTSILPTNDNTFSLGSSTKRWRINDSTIPTFDAIYPVGSIYMSINSTDPSILFGGTWEQITGRFLLACDTTYEAGATGGSSTISLQVENLPSHIHSVGAHAHGLNSHTHTGPSHTHTGPSHTHGLNGHTHTGPSHTHGMQSHTHGLSSHYHYVPAQNGSTDGRLSTSCIYLMRCTGNARAFATSAGDAGNITYSEQNGWPDDNYGLWQSFQRTGGENKYRPDRIIFYLNHAHSVSTNAVNSNGPSNNTTTASGTRNTGGNSGNTTAAGTGATGAAGTGATGGPSVANTANSTAFNSGSTGSGTAYNNMPPYLAVYVWKRVA